MIDLSSHQECSRTSYNIIFNWSVKAKHGPQNFDFTTRLSFVWINEFSMAAQIIDTYHHQLCARTSSIIIFKWFVHQKHGPRQALSSITNCFWFHEFVAWQCEINVYDWYSRKIQSSNIMTNQSMKTEHISRQVPFQGILFVVLSNLVYLNSKLTFPMCIFVAPNHKTS